MGFGLLFIGYFVSMLMVLNTVGFVIRPIGYAIMLVALHKLRDYHRSFYYAMLGCIAMLGLSAVLTVEGVSAFLYERLLIDELWISAGLKTALGYLEMVGSFVFHVLLLWAIRQIAKETEADKIAFAAARNLFFFAFYYLLYAIALLPFGFAKKYASMMSVPVVLMYFACLILNLILLFSCYAKICDVADEEMAVKPSRFAFVNRMRAESEERRREKDALYAQRARERKERKEQRKK